MRDRRRDLTPEERAGRSLRLATESALMMPPRGGWLECGGLAPWEAETITHFAAREPTPTDAVELACDLAPYPQTLEGVLGRRRHAAVALARCFAYWALHDVMGLSYPEIGRMFRRDHTTILAGTRRHRERLAASSDWRRRSSMLAGTLRRWREEARSGRPSHEGDGSPPWRPTARARWPGERFAGRLVTGHAVCDTRTETVCGTIAPWRIRSPGQT